MIWWHPHPYPLCTLDPLINISKFIDLVIYDHVEVFYFGVSRKKIYATCNFINFDTGVHMLKNYVIIIDLF